MEVAQAIIHAARDAGCERFFGLPGSGALMDVMEAGRRAGVSFVATAHESSAAIAAAAYGHFRGSAGLAMAIKGPGAGNLAGGAVNAHFERMPVVCLCEVAAASLGQAPLAQVCDHRGLYGGVAKGMLRIAPEGAAAVACRAFRMAAADRPGPVLLELPGDIGAAPASGAAEGEPRSSVVREPPAAAVAAARATLARFSRPLAIIGADVRRSGAAELTRQWVRAVGAAVLLTMDARGVYPESDPLFAGVFTGLRGGRVPGNVALAGADGIVLLGVDPLMTEAPWSSELPTLALVAREGEPALCPSPTIALAGEIGASIRALSGIRCDPGYPADRLEAVRRLASSLCARPAGARLAVQDIIATTRELLPEDGVLFSETGVFVLMLEQIWRAPRPDTFFGTTAGRSMGLMLPAALGARLARPELPMVGIGGNGSLLMRLGELEAFARTGAAVPLVIVNDRALGTIQARQKHRGLPRWGLEHAEVHFAEVARACGLEAQTVETPEHFREALRRALSAPRATLIDARVDPEPYQGSFIASMGA